ncbi:PREDICTED: uncharacterized protein At3g43530-like [Camelina sativa]|uniref:Uncharacterized protein At3g43530-like n=1 Tax=Camelina sativa TaxID=90675 RepID=A0ABM1Q773_CAMSA|nr:PREDICTED: uncharacterized protein At3g43530-like [Camelina sativa]
MSDLYDTLSTTMEIQSIMVPFPDEKVLMKKVMDDECGWKDVDDAIEDGWTKRIVKEKKPIFFENMHKADVASRAVEANPDGGNLAQENIGQMKQGWKKVAPTKVALKKMTAKFDTLDTRLKIVEVNVKQLKEAKKVVKATKNVAYCVDVGEEEEVVEFEGIVEEEEVVEDEEVAELDCEGTKNLVVGDNRKEKVMDDDCGWKDVDDAIEDGWTKRIVKEKKPIFFENMHKADVASRAVEANPDGGNLAQENIGQMKQGWKKVAPTKVALKKMTAKFDTLDTRLKIVEVNVKQLKEAKKVVKATKNVAYCVDVGEEEEVVEFEGIVEEEEVVEDEEVAELDCEGTKNLVVGDNRKEVGEEEMGIVDSAYGNAAETVEAAVRLGEEIVMRRGGGHVYGKMRETLLREVLVHTIGFDETGSSGVQNTGSKL